MIFIRDLSYSYPSAVVWLLALLPLFVLYCWYTHWRRRMADSFGSDAVISVVAISPPLFWLRAAAKLAAAALAIIALMGPRGNPQYPEGKGQGEWQSAIALKRKAHNIYFVIDSSASMTTRDTSAGKSRLSQAREIADEVAAKLNGESVALIAFTSEATMLVPVTMDALFFRMQLHTLAPNTGDVSGTDIATGLRAVKGSSGDTKTSVIVITDGGDNILEDLQDQKQEGYVKKLAALLPPSSLYIIGTGTVDGGEIPDLLDRDAPVHASLNENALKQLARESGGRYLSAETMSVLALVDTIIADINAEDPYISEVELLLRDTPTLIYDDYYQVPLAGALLLLGFALFFPDTVTTRRR